MVCSYWLFLCVLQFCMTLVFDPFCCWSFQGLQMLMAFFNLLLLRFWMLKLIILDKMENIFS
uniref:Uncharacterized protein n=1 Tax=Rhizophora mucronata TaxID=61149 RepID=A0A2P2NP70_RHIMU